MCLVWDNLSKGVNHTGGDARKIGTGHHFIPRSSCPIVDELRHNLETMPLTCNENKNAKIRPMKPGWIAH
ncbi:MAG TPA: hypothetical protein DCG41_09760 [Verrucomicrobiales bacterium]|nr:hypothetical protein [Verrucomicrobiales bacterium]